MQFLRMPLEARFFRIGLVGARRLVELLIFVWREPRPVLEPVSPAARIGDVFQENQTMGDMLVIGRLQRLPVAEGCYTSHRSSVG